MNTIVDRVDLLDAIRANRAKHKEEYTAALSGYREKAVEHFTAQLGAIRAGKGFKWSFDAPPEHYLSAYDRAIGMFERSVSTSISLTEDEFIKYALDEWDWKVAFSEGTMSYIDPSYGDAPAAPPE